MEKWPEDYECDGQISMFDGKDVNKVNENLFCKVSCSGYMKKVSDGKCIVLNRDELTADFIDTNLNGDNKVVRTVELDGDSFLKRYYLEVDKLFCGMVVGYKNIIVTADLTPIYQDSVDVGVGVIPEKIYVDKTAKEVVRCAIVYYASARKRYVPLDRIKTIG